MKKQMFLGLLILFSIGVFAQTNQTKKGMDKYESQWAQVEKFEKDGQPKSAKNTASVIFRSAVAAKNTPQIIKSLLYVNKYNIKIDSELETVVFSEIDSLMKESGNVSEKALLHSLIAELYLNYYDNVRWEISGRTDFVGYVPDNMREWTGNIFETKAIEHLKASVANQSELLKESVLSYKDILIEGVDSRRLYPTLYDFLIKRAIDQSQRISNSYRGNSEVFSAALKSKGISVADLVLPVESFLKLDFSGNDALSSLDFYQRALQSFISRKMDESVVFTEISRNNYLKSVVSGYANKYEYDFLLNLEKQNQDRDYNVEVIYALTQHLQGKYNADGNKNVKQIYDWCRLGLQKYPKYNRINILTSVLYDIESPYARIDGKPVYHPDVSKKNFTLSYRNLKSMTIKIVDKDSKRTVSTQTISLNPKSTYSMEEQDFSIDLNKVGNYELVVGFDKPVNEESKSNICEFSVSRLGNFIRSKEQNVYEFYVVDRLTGEPVKDAVVTISKTNSGKSSDIEKVKTDAKGFAVYDLSKIYNRDKNNLYEYHYGVSKGDDKPFAFDNFNYSYYFAPNVSNQMGDIVDLFTDRSIYRPGQTVYFKAVLLQQKEGKPVLNKNQRLKVELLNANGQVVEDKNLITNDFGSIAGEFILPKGGLTGQFSIRVGDNYTNFQVEEYKRPTFQVTFDKIDKAYTFGDAVKIIGHAENFSGIKLQNAEVVYNVVQRPFFRWWNGDITQTIAGDVVVTKEDGSFEINFTLPQKESNNDKRAANQIYNYEVVASVTDQNNEKQEGSISFVVGNVSTILSTEIGDKIDRASDKKVTVKAQNMNGENVSVNGTFKIYSLLANDSIKAEVKKGEFESGVTDMMTIIRTLPSAKYQLVLSTKDEKGRDIVAKNSFVLYSYDDKKPPVESDNWLVSKRTTFAADQNAEIAFGVSADNVTVLYEIFADNRIIEQKQIKLSNSIEKFSIPYKKEYGSAAIVVFTYFVNEKPYMEQVVLTKEKENKNLNLKFEVFRDKLKPGQYEEWRISVKDNQGKPVLAELLASMYDSSLDKLYSPSVWNLTAMFNTGVSNLLFDRRANFRDISRHYISLKGESAKRPEYSGIMIDRLNLFGFSFFSDRLYFKGVPSPAAPMFRVDMSAGGGAVTESRNKGVLGMTDELSESASSSRYGSASDATPKAPVEIRSNFNETAFFYPQLRTDKNGETIISFTVPQSNTIWKFRALAYDQSLNQGSLEALTVTRKELMITPNMPRFIRQGDKTSVSTKISNLSDKQISGRVSLVFFDPVTEQQKEIKTNAQYQNFILDKDASTSVVWVFDVPSGIDMLGCKIVAESESFSDGEQHVLPVLPNRMLVTESMTMNINGGQTKDFVFDRLVNNKSKSLSDYRLTFEYTGNPVWYAVQALPTLSNPTNENAVNWFASYYVNTLGHYISGQYPKVSAILSTWKMKGDSKEAMVSKLMQNDELKSVLLEETPWVLEAKDETEQMNRLSLLLDMNNSANQTSQAIAKLQDLQREDGGWSWYKGMYSSRSITQYILYGFSQLIHLNAVEYGENVKMMQINALKYIDKQILTDYENLKKWNKNWEKSTDISTNQLEYLYVRSFYRDIPIDKETRQAERFYTTVAEKNWTKLSLYEKSLLAILVSQNGNKELNEKIIKSLREYATINDEMGMFWANNNSYAFLGQSAVSVHTFLMEAFRNAKASSDEMDKMKQWLLKQKQTQKWESTHATIDAIYALLSTGSDWFASSGSSKVTINNADLNTNGGLSGIDYIKQSWTGTDITPDMGKVTISKSGEGVAWGAMYWQYYQDLDKITSHKGVLNVDKKLFVEQSSMAGKSLVEVSETTPLKVGSKVIVRLTVRADRDMEFVQLKDMRASCFEPVETLSGIKWRESTYYYQSTKDASTTLFFDMLPKGTYVFEYPVYVNRVGEYSNGITTIQSMYSPEYTSHTSGFKMVVK